MRFLLFCALLAYVSDGESANILAVFPLNGPSHFMVFQTLLKGLASKGHHVDVVSHFPQEKTIPRYNDLSLKGTLPFLVNNLPADIIGQGFFQDLHFMLTVTGVDLCKVTFNTSLGHDLKQTKKKYDVMITEVFTTDCMLGYAHVLNIPTIGITTSVNLPWASDRIGLPDNPAYVPNYFSSYLPKMTLKERVINTALTIGTKIAYNIISMNPSNFLAKNFFGHDLPDLHDLVNNMSLLLVNSHFSIYQSRPLPPNFIEIGGIHIAQNKSLSKYFEDMLITNLKGVIYLSFGSMLKTETFKESRIRGLMEGFSKLPYKVIWKGVREDFPKHIEIPTNIQFQAWTPQLDILCHPNVKLFVSHGGLLGTQEAIYCGVPILGIPLFADQALNIRSTAARGIALEVPFESISKDSVFSAAKELLEDTKYQRNVEELSRLFKDRPSSPLDTAIYWVEYIIRYNGAPHLRSHGADLPWYEYYLVDVAAVFLLVFLLACSCIYYIVLFVRFVIIFNKKQSKIKTN